MTPTRPNRRKTKRPKRGSSSVTHVAIIGAGKGGTALMEIFAKDPLVRIVGIAEINPKAVGLKLARRLHIPVTRDYHELLEIERVDLVIDVSGSPEVGRVLLDFHRMGVTIIGGASAKFMWQLIEARIRATSEIERTLNQYQTLYRLYVKESETAVSEERTQFACELHDGLVQSLAGLNFKLDLCQELLKKNLAAGLEALRETKAGLKTVIQEARQVIVNLRPVHYDKMELIPALTNYLKSYESQSHIKTEFSVAGDETTLFPKTKVFLFRIIQEALSNVQKHARADRVAVQIAIGKDMMTATIADNGVGFDVESVSRDPEKWDHFGLRGILERARLVGGQAMIESKKGKGTRVLITVPLVEKEAGPHGKN